MFSKTEKTIAKNHVIQEVIQTETTYHRGLTLLQKVLQIELNEKSNPLLNQIKQSVEGLVSISDKVLANVQEAVASELTPEKRKEYQVQRMQLLKLFFMTYGSYAQLYDEWNLEKENLQEEIARIRSSLTALQSENPDRFKLADLLISPVQRGPRYALLIKEMGKNVEMMDDILVKQIEEIKQLIAKLLQQSNTQMTTKHSEYHFGDYTLAIWGYFTDNEKTLLTQTKTKPPVEQPEPQKKPYHFGDFTWWALGWDKKEPDDTSVPSSDNTPTI